LDDRFVNQRCASGLVMALAPSLPDTMEAKKQMVHELRLRSSRHAGTLPGMRNGGGEGENPQ
jgi:hypothetical protein